MLTYADEEAVLRLHMQVEEDIKGVVLNDAKTLEVPKFSDRDNILDMPSLSYDDRFKSNVTQVVSTVKVPQGVYQRECGNRCEGGLASLPQDARKHIKASDGLESRVMKANLESDSSIRWQYVGFQSGVFRQVNYPNRHLNQSFPIFFVSQSQPSCLSCTCVVSSLGNQVHRTTWAFLWTMTRVFGHGT